MHRIGILGCRNYIPAGTLTNHQLAARFKKTEAWIEERIGIRGRRIVVVNITTSDMAAKEALSALGKIILATENIDLIIVATTTFDMVFMSTARLIQQKIGAAKAAVFGICAVCTEFKYGLDIAEKYMLSGQFIKVLLVGVDKYLHITNPNDLNTRVLFGDGAGAGLLSVPAGGSRHPISHELFESKSNTVDMNVRKVSQFAAKISGHLSYEMA